MRCEELCPENVLFEVVRAIVSRTKLTSSRLNLYALIDRISTYRNMRYARNFVKGAFHSGRFFFFATSKKQK